MLLKVTKRNINYVKYINIILDKLILSFDIKYINIIVDKVIIEF